MPAFLRRGALYARTLTHLHPLQVAFRPIHVVRTQALKRVRPLAGLVAGQRVASVGPALLALEGDIPATAIGVDTELARAREALGGAVTLVGQPVRIAPPRTDFTIADAPKLVRYQLNYLGAARSLAIAARSAGFDLQDEAFRLAIAHLHEFIDRVPPGEGDAWEPYPVAIRILNLVLARELLRPVAHGDDAAFLDETVPGSLAQHARWLNLSLELHLLGNHLFTDGVALFVAGCALETPESETWRTVGQTIISRSLATDVLADGGHSERSPMYAAIYLDQLEFVLAAARARGIPPPGGALRAAELMGRQLMELCHPDGDIPLLGDSAFDEAPVPRDLAGPLGAGDSLRRHLYGSLSSALTDARSEDVQLFSETGVAVVRDGDSTLVIDAGPLGSFDQPGHAHSDALTFELSWRGERLISDAGAGHYQTDDIRAYFRGPLAHSSVSVDGQGPDEVWGAFRAARRSTVGPLVATSHEGLYAIRGSVRAVWGWQQQRLFLFAPNVFLAVFDRVTGSKGNVISHLHFAPEAEVDLGEGVVRQGGREARLTRLVGSRWTTHRGEQEPFRGFTSVRMGVFEPSTEVAVFSTAMGDSNAAGYLLALSPDVSGRSTPTGAEIQWPGGRIRVDFDRGGVRWERL